MTWIDQRGELLSRAILEKIGNRVYSGPFAGTEFDFEAHSGNFAPWLLGIYEHELHDVIEGIIKTRYSNVLNVGCSFGYYAVGIAVNNDSCVSVCDIDPAIEKACIENGYRNGCKNILPVTFEARMKFASPNLIVMDCEGAEEEYLVPSQYDFAKTDILVECHECNKAGLTQTIIDRFKYTHHIKIIKNEPSYFDLKRIFGDVELEHFDNAIVGFEGRAGATPWLWMQAL
jgi:hypothetical protein